jgi:predicted tellurium resistance membrane protein TerC
MILAAHPWMRRATFIGLVIFVAVPLAMTGSVGGSILGRLLGMSRVGTFAGVIIGNLLGSALMYFGSGVLRNILKQDDPLLLIGGIIVVGLIGYVLLRRYQQTMKQAIPKKDAAS